MSYTLVAAYRLVSRAFSLHTGVSPAASRTTVLLP